ncbi:amino acid ABC transporter substrate-binding protein [Flavobacterium sp. J27]|uniref:amino acid ABC transporter substrate-binding protein n=1 Tax=Flavobacterium sp. J27 TaxID=2060419 RepID=UPI001030EC32|nr:amino acid ABC transporter substrate-binding protein [Flavobacterium sp. J27]
MMNTPPIRIGYSLSLTGPVADNTRSARLTHKIWEDQVNKKGGLLGRKVELICKDDQGDPLKTEAIYRSLLDDERVDLVIGGYGTNTIGAALPVVIEREKFLIGLMGLGVNGNLRYPHYFAMIPTGPNPNTALTEGFFELAVSQSPKPKTVALLSAEAEFSKNPIIGAIENCKKYDLRVIHQQTYPLSTTDFSTVISGIQEVNADILFLCSYLNDSIGLVKTIKKSTYRPKMVGGAMIGPQSALVKTQLGPLLNGFVNYEYWVPVPKMNFNGISEMLEKYQHEAIKENIDALGFYVAPLAYAQMQVLEQAINNTGSLEDEKLSNYCRNNHFETVMGNIHFGTNGEWNQPRVVQVQFQNIKNNNIETFMDSSCQVVVSPDAYVSGKFIYPFSEI